MSRRFEVCEVLHEDDGMTKGYVVVVPNGIEEGEYAVLSPVCDKEKAERVRAELQKEEDRYSNGEHSSP